MKHSSCNRRGARSKVHCHDSPRPRQFSVALLNVFNFSFRNGKSPLGKVGQARRWFTDVSRSKKSCAHFLFVYFSVRFFPGERLFAARRPIHQDGRRLRCCPSPSPVLPFFSSPSSPRAVTRTKYVHASLLMSPNYLRLLAFDSIPVRETIGRAPSGPGSVPRPASDAFGPGRGTSARRSAPLQTSDGPPPRRKRASLTRAIHPPSSFTRSFCPSRVPHRGQRRHAAQPRDL